MPTNIYKNREERLANCLEQISSELASFNNPETSLSIRIKITDQLWRFRPVTAQTLLRQHWKEVQQGVAQGAIRNSTRLAEDIVQVALQRQGEAADEWLRYLDEQEIKRHQEKELVASRKVLSFIKQLAPTSPPKGDHRFRLATALIRSGDVATAVRVVAPALRQITTTGMDFIAWLGTHHPELADNYYEQLIQTALADPASDANTVGTLLSHAYLPGVSPRFLRGILIGGLHNKEYRLPPYALQQKFLAAAATILRRPHLIADTSNNSPGIEGTYHVLDYLLAFVGEEDSIPVSELRQYHAALEAQVLPADRGWASSSLPRQRVIAESVPETPDLQSLMQAYRTASTSEEKDEAAATLGQALAGLGDPSALEYIPSITAPNRRRVAETFIEYALVLSLLKKADYDLAVSLALKGSFDELDKALTLMQAAQFYHAREQAKAMSLLADAVQHCQNITAHEQLIGLAVIGETFLQFGDEAQAWTMAVRIALAAEEVVFETDNEQQATDFSMSADQMAARAELLRYLGVNEFRDYVLPKRERSWEPETLFTPFFCDLAQRDLLRMLEQVQTIRKEVRRVQILEAIFDSVMGKDNEG